MACQFSIDFPRISNVFTPEDIGNFLRKEFSIKSARNSLENLIRANGLRKADVEEKIIQAAFDAFVPGQPIIPNERVLKVLEFRKVQKIGKAYGIPSDISWATLKKELTSRRFEVLSVYKKELTSKETDMMHTNTNPNVLKRCQQPEGNMPTVTSIRSPLNGQSKATSIATRTSARRSLIPVYQPNPHPRSSVSKTKNSTRDQCSNANAYRSTSTGWSNLPVEERTNDIPSRPSMIPTGSILNQKRLPDTVDTWKRKHVHSRLVAKQVSRDGRLPKHQQDTAVRVRTFSTVSIRTEEYSILQLAQSPEDQEIEELDIDVWTDEDELPVTGIDTAGGLAIPSPSGSIPGESPYHRTMRKLQEFLDEAIKQKSSRSRSKEEQYDFWTTQDPGFDEDDAFLSPRRPNQNCAFVFRGCKFQAPPTAERVHRHRTPVWCIREDPGSPTPKPGFLRANDSIASNTRKAPARVAKPLLNANGDNSRPSPSMHAVGYCTPRPRKRVVSRRR